MKSRHREKLHSSLCELDAGTYPVGDLISRLEKVKKDCGKNSLIVIDAGHCNVEFNVIPSKIHAKNVRSV